MIKPKHLKIWLLLVLLEGSLSGIYLVAMQFDSNRGHTLNYPAVFDIQAWDNPFCQHVSHPLISSIPCSPLFSG